MTALRGLAMLAVLLGAGGCYRTRYHHLEPPVAAPSGMPSGQTSQPSGWRHFFIYGWVPSEIVIDAARQCGGAEYVEEIRTRQRFLQGLIELFASAYINIYSPWTGEVVCREGGRK